MKVLIKTYAGSHLFGTSTPESDTDYKGVFIPSERDIILGRDSDTIQQSTGEADSKNSKDDVDVELYRLKKFLKMLRNGDTAAIELLFTPEEMIVEKSVLWEHIVAERHNLISRKIKGVIGYARHQANKYGIKGIRLNDLDVAIKTLKEIEKELDFDNPKLKHKWEEVVKLEKLEHVELTELSPNKAAKEIAAICKEKSLNLPAMFAILDEKNDVLEKIIMREIRPNMNVIGE